MSLRSIFAVSAIGLMTLAGCSSAPPKMAATEKADGKRVTIAAAEEVKAHDFAEISFEPGSAVLTENAKSSLRMAIDNIKPQDQLSEVLVLSWSDEEYPSSSLKRLAKPQRDLAARRNNSIERYVKSMRRVDVDLYNMAERPNVLSKWFNTTDSKLKNSLISAGLPTTADDPQYPSKASHSVVFIKTE